MTNQGWAGAPSDSYSVQSNSNMFHPRGGLDHSLDQSETGSIHELSRAKAKLREAHAKKEEEKQNKLAETKKMLAEQ